ENNLFLIPAQETVDLKKGEGSTVKVGNFILSQNNNKKEDSQDKEIFYLEGEILDSGDADSGEHSGTVHLNVEIVPATVVKTNR
ncbi:MAG: hypothetical protein ACRDB7_08320, partial [Fusobacteriaceae bacterium]